MAVRGASNRVDTSGLPAPLQKFTNRELRWLWSFIGRHSNSSQSLLSPWETYDQYNHNDRIMVIANTIKNQADPETFVKKIIAHHAESIIPKNNLEWINEQNHRQLIWAMLHLKHPLVSIDSGEKIKLTTIYASEEYPELPYIPLTPSELRHEYIIAALDAWQANLQNKIKFILEKKNEWAQVISLDKKTKWIDESNTNQLIWAWEYIRTHKLELHVPAPLNDSEYFSAVLASLDNISYQKNSAEKILFIEKMRRTWSQKKFRDSGKAKKQYYLPLTIKTREKLDWLAENWGCKQSDVLERLISEKHSQLKKES